MYALYLNNITTSCESSTCVATSNTKAALEQFLINARVDMYTDTGPDKYNGGNKNYQKVFKKGSPLEMFNPPEQSLCTPSGIIEVMSISDIQEYYDNKLKYSISVWHSEFGAGMNIS